MRIPQDCFCPRSTAGSSLLTGRPLLVERERTLSCDHYRSVEGPTRDSDQSILVDLKERIYRPDQKTLAELEKVNRRLISQGLSSIDFVAVTKEVEAIANDSSLTDKEKRAKINEVRKRLGLKKGEMKGLFTKRLEKIYGAMIAELKAAGRVNEPLLQRLEQNRKLYSSMYKPGGCIKKVFKGMGGFFKNTFQAIGKTVLGVFNPRSWFRVAFWRDVVAPAALHFVPALGPVVATVYKWYHRIGFFLSLGRNFS